MKTAWTKGLTGQAKEEMKSSFASGAALRARLSVLLQEKIDTASKDRVSKDAYANANWAYLQADLCGYERAMQEILSLLQN
jgi:hypothetical protein